MKLTFGLILLLFSNPLYGSKHLTYEEVMEQFSKVQFAPGVKELLETGFKPLYKNSDKLQRKSPEEEKRHIECLIDELLKCDPKYQRDAVLIRLSFHMNLLKSLPKSDSLKSLLEELKNYPSLINQ
jgi:hypothetical protein